VFEKVYSLYPRKDGKTNAKKVFIGYMSDDGREVKGQGKIRLNHWQIAYAVNAYAKSVADKDEQYIKYFSTFMNEELLDWVEKTAAAYERRMIENHGEEWGNIKFKYTFAGINPRKSRKRKKEIGVDTV
jgi:hypothetical protein